MRSLVPLALVALLAAGCGSSNEPESGASASDPASTPASTPASDPATDPATVAGACAVLVRDGLVDEALSVARDPGKAGSRPVSEVQNDLFAIVAAGTTSLVDPT